MRYTALAKTALEEDQAVALTRLADREQTTVAELLRRWIREALQRAGALPESRR